MQIELLVNGGVSILLVPDNVMEEELIKQLMKQDNILTEIRSSVMVLNKTFRSGILIGKNSTQKKDEIEITLDDQENKEAL
jgi:hypothetical protein